MHKIKKRIITFYTPFDSAHQALSNGVENIVQTPVLNFVHITRNLGFFKSCQNQNIFTDLDSTLLADHEYV